MRRARSAGSDGATINLANAKAAGDAIAECSSARGVVATAGGGRGITRYDTAADAAADAAAAAAALAAADPSRVSQVYLKNASHCCIGLRHAQGNIPHANLDANL